MHLKQHCKKNSKEKHLLQHVLARRGKEEEEAEASTLLWLKSTKFIALWTLCLPQSNVYERQLELQQVSLIPFPHLENIFSFVNHNSTVAVCLSFMFIVDIVCMCRMNL